MSNKQKKKEEKAFRNHRTNGVYLRFPNGNGLSTVWGSGTYCDNYNYEIRDEKGGIDYEKTYSDTIPEGSDTCEVMPDCGELVKKLLDAKFPDNENGRVFGHLTFAQWLEMVNILNDNL